jgi:hypothetical protein
MFRVHDIMAPGMPFVVGTLTVLTEVFLNISRLLQACFKNTYKSKGEVPLYAVKAVLILKLSTSWS